MGPKLWLIFYAVILVIANRVSADDEGSTDSTTSNPVVGETTTKGVSGGTSRDKTHHNNNEHERSGTCPHKVTPKDGYKHCSTHKEKSDCKVDKDCHGAKKCCEDGCKVLQCRNPMFMNKS